MNEHNGPDIPPLAVPWTKPSIFGRLFRKLTSHRAAAVSAALGLVTAFLAFGQTVVDSTVKISSILIGTEAPSKKKDEPILVTQMVPAGQNSEYYFYNITDDIIEQGKAGNTVVDPVDTITYFCPGNTVRIGNSTRNLVDLYFVVPESDDFRPIGQIGYGQYVEANIPGDDNAIGEMGIYSKDIGFLWRFMINRCPNGRNPAGEES